MALLNSVALLPLHVHLSTAIGGNVCITQHTLNGRIETPAGVREKLDKRARTSQDLLGAVGPRFNLGRTIFFIIIIFRGLFRLLIVMFEVFLIAPISNISLFFWRY